MTVFRNSRDAQSLPINSVKPYAQHARRHSKVKIEKLKGLLRQFGQVAPILVDGSNIIISGHALHIAMTELGAEEIAAISITGRDEAEIKALRLALNRLPLEAKWDDEKLRAELQELVELNVELDLTGFEIPEIDHLLDVDLAKNNLVNDRADIGPVEQVAVSATGDIWTCGRHHVGCGDALDQIFVDSLLMGTTADLCFIDPPALFVSSKCPPKHRKFAQEIGELSSAEFITYLAGSLKVLQTVCKPRALIYACMDWRCIYELIGASRECRLELLDFCVWAKTDAGTGSLYRNQHELVCVFKVDSELPTANAELTRHGRNRSNLWTYRGPTAFAQESDALHASDSTVKPVSLIADVLRDVTKRGGVVIDSFLGSGSTLMAAEETDRTCFGVEINPVYVDVAVRRWQGKTASDAVHATTGETFNARTQRILGSQPGPSDV